MSNLNRQNTFGNLAAIERKRSTLYDVVNAHKGQLSHPSVVEASRTLDAEITRAVRKWLVGHEHRRQL